MRGKMDISEATEVFLVNFDHHDVFIAIHTDGTEWAVSTPDAQNLYDTHAEALADVIAWLSAFEDDDMCAWLGDSDYEDPNAKKAAAELAKLV
jgi:hypothetical protein